MNLIQNEIFPICYEVEFKIVKNDEKTSTFWAMSNSYRHSILIENILKKCNGQNRIKILNASGIACGHQDFSIMHYLRKRNIDIDYYVIDSPNNDFISNETFKNYIKELHINLVLIDFNHDFIISDLIGSNFDIVIFTEIAEHLDYSTFLRTLKKLYNGLEMEGLLLITTPNFLSLRYRFKMLKGSTNSLFWGDGTENLSRGLYGHITYYDTQRLKRILNDIGFTIIDSFTFDYGYRKNFIQKVIQFIKKTIIQKIVINSNSTIFIKAAKCSNQENKIPYRI